MDNHVPWSRMYSPLDTSQRVVKLEHMLDQFLDKMNGKYPDHRLLHSKVCDNHILQWLSFHLLKKIFFVYQAGVPLFQ